MQSPLTFSRLLDNHHRGSVGAFLKANIRSESALSVVSAYFTIYAYDALKPELERIASMRFLFGEPNFVKSLDPNSAKAPAARIEKDELSLEHSLKQSRVAKACADWMSRKLEIRSIIKPGFLHGKAYYIEQGDYKRAVLGSSNFTVQGLGLGRRGNIELNLELTDDRDREDLKQWFEDVWNDTKLSEDVKPEVLRHLERLYVPNAPQFVYFKTLYHLFSGTQNQAGELKIPQRLMDSQIWNALYPFQKDGVKAAIRKLQTFGGCILADSVGLGKTYTALAVMKYFESLNDRVLVLSPKKLRENWTVYHASNNSNINPFLQDRFAYSVLSHTDLSRESGLVADLNLETINWGNYDLVVIDESHNFRNNSKGRRDENGKIIKQSRYERLLEEIIKAGVPTKVLLLSATPVNNDLSDLRNQLMLISGGTDNNFATNLGVLSLKNVLAVAQREFNTWASKEPRIAEHLLERLSANFFSLLDGLTLARSRKHIRDYYPETVTELGGFPTRLKPISMYSQVDTKHFFPSYEAIHQQISGYQLALFSPSSYVLPEHIATYDTGAVQNFSQANRERYLIGMMKVNFLKRLESSVHSFAITLERTCTKITGLITKLEAFITRQETGEFESLEPDLDGDDDLEAALQVGKRIKYDLRHIDVQKWLTDLRADEQQLHDVFDVAKAVSPTRDAKLTDLKNLLENKIKNPSTNKLGLLNRKVLVFTAFSDTAMYLYNNLEPLAKSWGVHIALVTGSGGNASTLGKADYNTILTNFAPRAKQRNLLKNFVQDTEIDILIATDCISEGQNLQDCDYLINFDIHWNPVRLIQRFGRIDRIGSQNQNIQMVNFWATPDLNTYLNLKNRVEARMALVDITATAQDNPLSFENIQSDLNYRDQQLLRMKDEVLDLEDIEGGVTLADFSLDDFRMDLSNFTAQNQAALENAPLGIFGLVSEEGNLAKHGIVFCLRQIGSLANTDLNPLSPYFLVYVRSSGEVRFAYAQAKQTLELYRALCSDKTQATQAIHDHFDTLTQNLENLETETNLLKAALESIRTTFKKRATQSLFTGRGAVIPKIEDQVTEETHFELITWLAILENPETTN
jgi:superfamily II DNA or RNA helicase